METKQNERTHEDCERSFRLATGQKERAVRGDVPGF